MQIPQKDKQIEDIETDLGNRIFKQLRKDGWKIVSQYPSAMFDKGIDYDSYTLKRNKEELHFEWTNWFEWTISGKEAILTELAETYSLKPPTEIDPPDSSPTE